MKNDILNKIIQTNLPKIIDFYKKNLRIKLSSKAEKFRINCPYCPMDQKHPHGDTNYHLVINLDWGVSKCFHCGVSKPNTTILKHFNLYHEYLELIQDLSNLSLYELLSLIKEDFSNFDNKKIEITGDVSREYIKENNLVPVVNIPEALEYAKSRTNNNKQEIFSYYANSRYIYIPIFKNQIIVAFIARKYVDKEYLVRYKYIKLIDSANPVAFIDEVEANWASDSVYITEGYFDALAINSSFGDYKAVAIFSKSNTSKIIDNFYSCISQESTIIITLDSASKDPAIYENIDQIYNKLKGYFQNINICLLPDHDPSYIFTKYGPKELIRQLENYTISSSQYLKKRLVERKEIKSPEIVETVKLPKFLLDLKKRS